MTDGLRRGALLEICIDLYRRHRDNGAGRCLGCPATPVVACTTRRNCEKVLVAAGLDPTKFSRSVNYAW
jgi:hypothetical protein